MDTSGQVEIRLFVSSTFDDFATERKVLQEGLRAPDGGVLVESPFRMLQQRCRAAGAALEIVDLRWGISAAASRAHLTMERCLTEVDRACGSPGPNFLALLGQRYGWVPLPTTVSAGDFAAILQTAADDGKSLLRHWYRREDNLCPAAYLLRDDDQPGLAADQTALRAVFAAARRLLGWEHRPEFGASATEQEIRRALASCSAADPSDQAVCYLRTLDGLPSAAAPYRDCDADGVPDRAAAAALQRLRAEVLAHPAVAARQYQVRWADYQSAAAVGYLARLAGDVFSDLSWRLDRAVEAARANAAVREERVHADFAASRRRLFQGRDGGRRTVADYLSGPAAGPLIVTGQGGSGKSALLAVAADLGGQGTEPLVERYIGVSPEASMGGALASGICAELGLGTASDPYDLLAHGLANGALVLVVDGLDLLAQDDDFLRFRWLPAAWPPNLHVLLSSRQAADAQRLSRLLAATTRIELGLLAPTEASALFSAFLHDAGRTVTAGQREVAAAAMARCPSPLFVRILSGLATGWSANDPVALDVTDVRDIIGYAFDSLSADYRHGTTLVSAALRLLAASRFGLADGEMLDALSHDDDVMASFRSRHPDSPAIGDLPYIVWSGLRDDLAPYLAWRTIGRVEVADFFHRELREVADERYLRRDGDRHSPASHVKATHGRLAAMFRRQGTSPEGQWLAQSRRAAGEILHHLLEADDTGYFDELTERADYLRAAAGHTTFYAGQSQPLPGPADDMIRQLRRRGQGVLAEALSAAGDVLSVRPQALPQVVQNAGVAVRGQLAVHGVGIRRLGTMPPVVNDHGSRITAAAASPDGAFLATGDMDGMVAWRSTATCEPLWCQAGHGSWVTGLAVSPDGTLLVSTGDEGSIMVWNAATGRREALRLPRLPSPKPQASHAAFTDGSHFIVRREAAAFQCDAETGRAARQPEISFALGLVTKDADAPSFSRDGAYCAEFGHGGPDFHDGWLAVTVLATGERPLDVGLPDVVASAAIGGDRLLLLSTADGFLRYDLRSPAAPPVAASGPVMQSLSPADGGFVGLDRRAGQVLHIDGELAQSVVAQLRVTGRSRPCLVRSVDPGRIAVCFANGRVEVRAIRDGRAVASVPALRLSGGTIARDGARGLGWLSSRPDVAVCEPGRPPTVKTTPHSVAVVGGADSGNGHLVTVDAEGHMVAWRGAEVSSNWTIPMPVSAVGEWRDQEGVAIGSPDCRVQLIGPRAAEVDIRSSLIFGRMPITALEAAGSPPQVAAVLQSGLVACVRDGEVSWRPRDPSFALAGTSVALLAAGVADGNELGVVRLWGAPPDEPILEWNAHRGAVAWIGHIGGAIASAEAAGTLYVVDISTGEVVGAMFVNGGIAAVRVVSASGLAVLRRDGHLVHYRLESDS